MRVEGWKERPLASLSSNMPGKKRILLCAHAHTCIHILNMLMASASCKNDKEGCVLCIDGSDLRCLGNKNEVPVQFSTVTIHIFMNWIPLRHQLPVGHFRFGLSLKDLVIRLG